MTSTKVDDNKTAWIKPAVESLGSVQELTGGIVKPKTQFGVRDDLGGVLSL